MRTIVDRQSALDEFDIGWLENTKGFRYAVSRILQKDQSNEKLLEQIVRFYNFVKHHISEVEIGNMELSFAYLDQMEFIQWMGNELGIDVNAYHVLYTAEKNIKKNTEDTMRRINRLEQNQEALDRRIKQMISFKKQRP